MKARYAYSYIQQAQRKDSLRSSNTLVSKIYCVIMESKKDYVNVQTKTIRVSKVKAQ